MECAAVREGERYGKLTAIRKIPSERSVVCICDCGREVTVPEAHLLAGVIASCGCIPGRIKDLTGKIYGDLKVIEPVPGRAQDGSVRWLCRCRCGEYTTVSSNKLRTGHTTSCGCRRKNGEKPLTYIDGTCVELLTSDKLNANNTSGHKGVAPKGNKWQAYITYRRKMHWLGLYDTYQDAVRARETAESRLRDHLDELMSQENPAEQKDSIA